MISKYLLVIVMAVLFIGCDKADGGGNSTTQNIKNRVITPADTKPEIKTAGMYSDHVDPIVEINLDELTFEEAFEIEYRAKGEGRTFWWRSEQYTTNLDRSMAIKWHNSSQWVQNSNDLDDKCYTNEFDECGVCDGPGKLTWYKDWDEDGLGDPDIFIESCIYPSVDEE